MRIAWGWAGALVVVAAAIVAGVGIANATVFSASAFARDYLQALSADRIDEVLDLPGVNARGVDDSLLAAGVGERFVFEILGEEQSDGVHRVRVAFGADPDDLDARTVLEIERVGSRFALFPRWGFATAPVTELTVELSGDSRFTVGGELVDADAETATVTLLRPGIYRVGHESLFLEARATRVNTERARDDIELAITANDHFHDEVASAVERTLETCSEQAVLYPIGCPFGAAVTDRVIADPVWTLGELPALSIEPGEQLGLWRVARFTATVQLQVEVQDLYDGSVDDYDDEVRFDAEFDISFDGDRIVLLGR